MGTMVCVPRESDHGELRYDVLKNSERFFERKSRVNHHGTKLPTTWCSSSFKWCEFLLLYAIEFVPSLLLNLTHWRHWKQQIWKVTCQTLMAQPLISPAPLQAGHPTSVSDGSASDQPGPSSAYNLKKKLKIPPNNLVV